MTARSRSLLAGLVLVALALVAYLNSFSSGLVLDNSAIIAGDPRLRFANWHAIAGIFSEDYWWPMTTSGLYRPLTTLSYWFNYTVLGNGAAPVGYHVINLLLHVANIILLWRFALYLGATTSVAWGAAAVFAVHPLGVEAVTNIVGRADLFATLGVLATALMWLRSEDTASRKAARGWKIGAAVVAFLAVFAKETGVLAAGAIGLLLVWRHGWRVGVRRFFSRDLPVVAPALIASVVIRIVMHHRGPDYQHAFVVNPLVYVDGWTATMTAIGILGRYLFLAVCPAVLSCDYSYSQIPLFGSGLGGSLSALTSLLLFASGGFWLWRRRAAMPLIVGALVWAGVMMLPTSNLLVKIGSIMAERFMYLPMTGLAVAAASAFLALVPRVSSKPMVLRCLTVGVLTVLTVRTLIRNADWQDEFSLWTSAVKASPNSYKVHKGLAVALVRREPSEAGLDRAIARAEVGLHILESPPLPIERQDDALWGDLGELYRIKGELAQGRGDSTSARAWTEKSIAILDRAFAHDRWINDQTRAHLRARGIPDEKILEHANARICTLRAQTLLNLNRVSEAVDTIRTLQLADPLNTDALMLLSRIDRANGDLAVAAVRLIEISLINPENGQAMQLLAEIYAQIQLAGALSRAPDGHPILDGGNVEVVRQINTAFIDIVDTLRRARQFQLMEDWKTRAIRDYHVAVEVFQGR